MAENSQSTGTINHQPMAKIEKNNPSKKQIKAKNLWFENKIARIRSLSEQYAHRATRFGAPAGVALLFFLVVYSLSLPKDRFQQTKEKILRNSNDPEAHLILAEEFLNNNELDKAEQELLIASNIQQTTDNKVKVLGITSKIEELWNRWREQNPQTIEKEIAKWQEFVAENPTYRDGYLRLALYYQKLKYLEEARVNLAKALELDPNFPGTKKLQEVLGE